MLMPGFFFSRLRRLTGVWGSRASRLRLLRHALPISLLILRKKPIVLQSTGENIFLTFSRKKAYNTVKHQYYAVKSQYHLVQRVSMGLTDRRKTAKNLVDSRKNWKISTVSRK